MVGEGCWKRGENRSEVEGGNTLEDGKVTQKLKLMVTDSNEKGFKLPRKRMRIYSQASDSFVKEILSTSGVP